MNIHIALYRWKDGTSLDDVQKLLDGIEALADKIPGVLSIQSGKNTSKYSEGYTHVILVRAQSAQAVDDYRQHPEHARLATAIDSIEDKGIGVDFEYPKA